MKEKIAISKKDFYETLYLIEKIIYIYHRASSREDADNNAYSLAITFAKEKILLDILALRKTLCEYLNEEQDDEIEQILEPIDDIKIPYGLSLEELRAELEPFLPKCENVKKHIKNKF